ncbi:ArsR/SmtB family transcription factor [Halosolutus amylolyticus]|uniref:ArsR/SmtB family transcription factor n=1 Tax=Halosolutus amylolyticus TaxID=2932267 RepID=A0ABD5PPI4_9EURY|nr:metalloregulator ArsR/SmtB family transcription factor [Halosolutus amylolyticus]
MSDSESTGRLRRYLEDEMGICRDENLNARMEELEQLEAEAGESVLERDVAVLSAVANETRYKIVRLLVAADGELCVCEISPLVDVSQSGISHALSQLFEAGLVTRRKDGKWRKYRATQRAIALVTAIDGSR